MAADPSMEEILASIRRIIADDQAPPTPVIRAPAAAPRPARVEAAPNVEPAPRRDEPRFEPSDASQILRNAAAQRERAPAPRVTIDVAPPIEQPAPPLQAAPLHAAPMHKASAPALFQRDENPVAALLSPLSDASVATSFEALARTAMLQHSNVMEESVRDMLRPMLKQWLDDNLPVMVERLVRAEIERVARGGR